MPSIMPSLPKVLSPEIMQTLSNNEGSRYILLHLFIYWYYNYTNKVFFKRYIQLSYTKKISQPSCSRKLFVECKDLKKSFRPLPTITEDVFKEYKFLLIYEISLFCVVYL